MGEIKDVDNRIQKQNIKWENESIIIEDIVKTILKTISNLNGDVEMPKTSMVSIFLLKTFVISEHNAVQNNEFKYQCLQVPKQIFCLQRQDQRIKIAPVDDEIIGLARNLAFPTFQKSQEDKVGI